MKRVMLLGDSIRMSYQGTAERELADIADVWAPDDNGRFVKYTLWYISAWVEECGSPDLIHWNNGIWDIYRQNPEIGIFTPLDEYLLYLQKALRELRKTKARIIWGTTTPVRPACTTCRNADIDRYNAEAARFMTTEGIAINDLNALLKHDVDAHLAEDHVHLSDAGIAACGKGVAQAIRERL